MIKVGFEGLADLKAVSDAKGATVYKDHLPLLGESIRPGGTVLGSSVLAVGDQVLVFKSSSLLMTCKDMFHSCCSI